MKFKRIMLITLLLLAVLTIGAVSASDNLTDTTEEVLADVSLDETQLSDDDMVSSAQDEIIKETDDGTFSALQNKINDAQVGSIIKLENNYTYDSQVGSMGITITKSVTIDGQGHTIDAKSQGRIFNIQQHGSNVVLKNITFANGYTEGFGGAVQNMNCAGLRVDSCIFNNCHADEHGGAIRNYDGANFTVTSCTFTDCSANWGGALHIDRCTNCTVSNSIFIGNNANYGGVIYWDCNEREIKVGDKNIISNCTFKDNNVSHTGGAIYLYHCENCNVSGCNFTNNSATLNSGAIELWNTNNNLISNCNFEDNYAQKGGAVDFDFSKNCKILNSNFTGNTAEDGSDDIATTGNAKVTLENVSPENLTIKTHVEISAVAANVKYGNTVVINVFATKDDEDLNEGSVFVQINNKTYTAEVVNGFAYFNITGLEAGDYNLNVTNNGDEKLANGFDIADFTVFKLDTAVTAAAKTYVINYGGKYSVTLKDEDGKALAGKTVTLTLNGKTYKAVTGSNGVATFSLTKAMLKSAGVKTATIKFVGDTNYTASTVTAKITVKKEAVKILKAKKTYKFKRSKKTKNIKVTFKNSKNKVMKKVKVTIKLSGKKIKGKKTITAKTNKKCIVTFKLGKKLTKKTKVKYTITYKGNGYYNKVTKKGKIQIK